MKETPLVSIICTAYNHEAYIKDALEGFVMQKTNFQFEIIVHDDASTDNTASIVKSYELKYPELFANIYQIENQYSKGNGDVGRTVYGAARGKYIALCEGDDYWTDPFKLQKQVDFLEANDDYSICYHRVKELFPNGKCLPEIMNKSNKEETFTIYNLAKSNFIHTPSVIFRKENINKLPNWFKESPIGDYPLHMLNAKCGKIKYLPELMAIYRIQGQGNWSSKKNYERIKIWMIVLNFLLIEFKEDKRLVNSLTEQLLKSYSRLEMELLNKNVHIYEFELETSKLIYDIPSFRSLWFNKCYFTRYKRIHIYMFCITNSIKKIISKAIRAIRNRIEYF